MTKAFNKVSGVQAIVALSAIMLLSACADNGPRVEENKPKKSVTDKEVTQAAKSELFAYAVRTEAGVVTAHTTMGADRAIKCGGEFKLGSQVLVCLDKTVSISSADGKKLEETEKNADGTEVVATEISAAGEFYGYIADDQMTVKNVAGATVMTQDNVKSFALNQNTVAYMENNSTLLIGKKLADQSDAFEMAGVESFQMSDTYLAFSTSNFTGLNTEGKVKLFNKVKAGLNAIGKKLSGKTLYLHDLASAQLVTRTKKGTDRDYLSTTKKPGDVKIPGYALQVGNGAYMYATKTSGKTYPMTDKTVFSDGIYPTDEQRTEVVGLTQKLQGSRMAFFSKNEKTVRIYDLTAKTLSEAIENVDSLNDIQMN